MLVADFHLKYFTSCAILGLGKEVITSYKTQKKDPLRGGDSQGVLSYVLDG